MEKKEILNLVKTIGKTVRQIEIELGMPQSTLNKAVLGTRELPEKWEQPLLELANPSKKESVKNTTLSKTEEVFKAGDDEADKESEEDFDRMIDHHEELQNMLPDPPEEEIIAPTLERQDIFDKPEFFEDVDPKIKYNPPPFYGAKDSPHILDESGQSDLRFSAPHPWIKQIEVFCAANNCTPEELMAAYQQLKKPDTNWLSDLLNKEGS